jgi:hypothetical protein
MEYEPMQYWDAYQTFYSREGKKQLDLRMVPHQYSLQCGIGHGRTRLETYAYKEPHSFAEKCHFPEGNCIGVALVLEGYDRMLWIAG